MMTRARGAMIRALAAASVLAACVSVAAAAQQHAPAEGFADLSERLSPAVVNIRTSQNISGGLPTFPPGSPLERFNDYLGGAPRTESSLGSGFVIDPSGIIVTNNHVIEDADAVEVSFPDGRTIEANIVGRDPATDLAVLKVVGDHVLPAVPWGDSDAARVGDWVVAIGNPFGLGQTLTVGVISARNRDIQAGNYDDFIQTDAAINRGNSGGPLFNLDGEVIGVNSAILSPSGGSVGIGFSIPSSLAISIVDQLLEFGETRRGWLGANVQAVDPELAEAYGLDHPYGAVIRRVDEDGPAADAGLEQGDLILSFDGQEVTNDRTLTRMVADAEVGGEVAVEYKRRDQTHIAMVTIERREGNDPNAIVAEEAPPQEAGSVTTVLGIVLAPLDEEARRRHGIVEDAKGVLVTYIQPGSDAVGKVRVGDVIEEIAWEPATSPQDAADLAEAAAENAGGKPILVIVNRGGQILVKSVRANPS
jgi:serine protease Do